MLVKPSYLLFLGMVAFTAKVNAEDLLSIYQTALESAPALQAAGFKVDMGNAIKGESFGTMLPQISGTANWSDNKYQHYSGITPLNPGVQNYPGTRYFVSLTQTIMDFAKYWDWRRTQELEQQYNAELVEAQQNLIVDVVKRYFAILDAQDQLYYLETEQHATENYKVQMDKLFAKQLVKITDVYQVESRLDQIKADRIEAESLLSTSQQAIKELTNTTVLNLARLREDVKYTELEGKLDAWLEVAKAENPGLRAQRYAISSASNDVAVKQSRHLPTVDLQLYFYDTNTGYQSTNLNQDTKTQVAALNVNVPIFSGGTITQAVRESQSKLAITNQENESKVRALIKETSEAFTLSNANARRIQASLKAVQSASKSYEAMQTGFKYGVKTLRDVLESQQDEYKAKRDLAKARYNYIANRIRFLKAIGTVSEQNLMEINSWLDRQSLGQGETASQTDSIAPISSLEP